MRCCRQEEEEKSWKAGAHYPDYQNRQNVYSLLGNQKREEDGELKALEKGRILPVKAVKV